MLISPYQKAGQKHSIKTANRSFENVAKFKYLETKVTDSKCIHKEIKSRLNSGNACYHSVQSLLSSRLLSRNVKVKIYKPIILPAVFYGCETWSLALREEHAPRVFENRVLRRISGPKRDEVTGEWRKLHNDEFHDTYSSPDSIRQIKKSEKKETKNKRERRRTQSYGRMWSTTWRLGGQTSLEIDGCRKTLPCVIEIHTYINYKHNYIHT
jgi:hypothetical protein